MNTTAIADLLCAVYTGILFSRHFSERGLSRSNRLLNLCLAFMLAALLIDASAYTFTGPSYPLPFRFFINFLTFMLSGVIIVVFIYYEEALFFEKGGINPWIFRILKTAGYALVFATAYEFIAGHLLTYDVEGIENLDYAFPAYVVVLNLAIHAAIVAVTALNARRIGKRMAALLCIFGITPILTSVLYNFVGIDFAYALGSITLGLVAEFIQKRQTRELKQEQETVKELADRQRSLKAFGDMVNAALWSINVSDADEVIGVVWSDEFRRMFGFEETEEDFPNVLESWTDLLHPEDKASALDNFYSALKSRDTETFAYDDEFRMHRKSGDYIWYHAVGRMRYNDDGTRNLFGIAFNITQDKRIEQQQKEIEAALYKAEEEATLRSMVYEISDSSQWVYEISADDEVVSVNYSDKLLSKVNAQPTDSAMGWIELLHPEDKERTLEGFLAAIRDRSGRTIYDETYRIIDRDGNCRWIHSVGRVIRRPDGSGEYIGMATDFTEQVREQERQQEQLAAALSMADAANRAKTDFLFNMSHDIRTPMNAIIGFTNIAKKEIDNREKALESLEKVQASSDILLNLINDVLDMSRIESGKVELHEEKYEVEEAFDSFEAAMAGLAASKDVDLKFSVGEIRDRYIFTDGPRFDRVLINIISNAIKYTPAGGFVRVSVDQIADTQPGYGNYRFTVADSGIGMSEEFQKHMFEDFTREENSTTSGIQGTGLGLSLAKKLIELMGGTISCVSRQGIGTTFTLVFPFRLQTEADIAEGSASVKEQVEIDLRGKKALLVEDNELNREIAAIILSDEGIIVETAENGQKAVNTVRERGADYYDFILMDIQMPVMDGYEATRAIHRLMPELRAPIIALSANAFAEDRKKSLEAGMDDHVAKPISIPELFSALARFM